jgi:LysM repeat protein
MKKFLFPLYLLSIVSTVSFSKSSISCLNLPAGTYNCNPYEFKILRKEDRRYIEKKAQLSKKTVKKRDGNLIQDLIDRYVKINEPIRYKGDDSGVDILDRDSINHYISMAQSLKNERESLISKIIQEEEMRFNQQQLIVKEHRYQQALEIIKAKKKSQYGFYSVKSGDTLSHIAYMFGMSSKELAKLNNIDKSKPIKIKQKITLPYTQEKIDSISKAKYVVKSGDNLHRIAKAYDLRVDDIIKFNSYKENKILRVGEVVKLPLPYRLLELKREAKAKEEARKKRLAQIEMRKYKKFGRHRLRVTATAYTSHRGQTDKTPFLAAWNNRIRPGMKIIAVSRDLLYRYGLKNGSKIKIAGLRGYYTVRDKMNKRYRKRIDIYMGTNRRKALRWGRRSVVIYW